MDESIKAMLVEEIASEFQELSSLEPGSVEHASAVEDLTKLYKLEIDGWKAEIDAEEKRRRRSIEIDQYDRDLELKKDQFNSDLRQKNEQSAKDEIHRYFNLGVSILGIGLPLAFYAYWMGKGFKFEETGTFTSTTFRGLINCFRPTKK